MNAHKLRNKVLWLYRKGTENMFMMPIDHETKQSRQKILNLIQGS